MSRWICGALAAALLLGAGCGNDEQEQAEERAEEAIKANTGDDADVDMGDGRMTVKTEDGTFQMSEDGDLKLPDGFPDDVFVLDDHKISWSTSSAEAQHVTYKTSTDMAKAVEEYKKEMADDGWKSEFTTETPEGTMLSFKKGENRTANVSIGKDKDDTQVTLMINNAE